MARHSAEVGRISSLGLLCFLAYANTLWTSGFIRDDTYLVEQNPLLHSRASFRRLWTTGYVEGLLSGDAGMSLYRPVAMASHFADKRLFGDRPAPMHAVNMLLYAVDAVLLYLLLKRLIDPLGAWLASLFFAVSPIHTEVVSVLIYRTELLALAGMLAAWLLLHGETTARRLAFGSAAYAAALLSKEHAIVFPAVLVLSDWTFSRVKPWSSRRRAVFLALGAVSLAYLCVRALVFAHPFQDGPSYFPAEISALQRALTISKFWTLQYLWPALTGAGSHVDDYTRPLIPDSGVSDLGAWACLGTVAGSAALGAFALLRRRSRAAFWVVTPYLFLLPTAHLVPLCALGGQRFFYAPSMSIAVGLGEAFRRLLGGRRAKPATALCAALLGFYLLQDVRRNRVWSSKETYYTAAVSANPVSEPARFGYAMVLLGRGERREGERQLRECIRLNPASAVSYYSLGKLAWEAGNRVEAEKWMRASFELNPRSTATLSFLGLLSQAKGDRRRAEEYYLSALETQPWDAAASVNLGFLYWQEGRRKEGAARLRSFLEMHPDDPDAGRVREFLER